uniref:NudC domain-containing protein 1 n=1 Tax=Glossina palpalis gambiensis TaxID=67801 RepID=A0A1B0AX37_9MUSC
MPKIVELRQDRSLICNNFHGYKLSLDAIPVLRQELTAAPFKAEPNEEEQYSFLHMELFSMQNLLQVDPWSRKQSYFVNSLSEIVRASYDENSGRPDEVKVVFKGDIVKRASPEADYRKIGDYNYTLRFISEKYCVLCDGIQTLILFDTGDRLKAMEWKVIAECSIKGDFKANEERNFTIFDCRLDIIQDHKQISLALAHVQRVDLPPSPKGGNCTYYMHVHWANWSLVDKQWEFKILDTLESKGSLYYCAFEPRAESLIVCGNREVVWRSQKVTQLEEAHSEEKQQLHTDVCKDEIKAFTWSQTDDDIIVKFSIKPNKDKNDYNVKCTANEITVKCNDEILLEQQLFGKIDQDLTTWTIENNSLQISLMKQSSGIGWPYLLADERGPKESINGSVNNSVPLEQRPIANLEAPLEDCDFPLNSVEDEIIISRFHLKTRSTTHNILLGSTPPLFTTSLRAGYPLALVTRQDVDACLWLLQYHPSKPDEWSLRHEGNLHAFGYIQASKQQKKFIDCSPDLSYVLICESHRHVFLYKSKHDNANGLRNRNGPQITVGKQHLITLGDDGEVLGLSTANDVAIILTTKYLLYLQIS